MGHVIGITGTPGTGKKSVARLLGRRLGMRTRSIRDIALELGAADTTEEGIVVDVGDLKRKLGKRKLEGCVIYGHLLPSAVPPAQMSRVAVLRTEPSVLKGRLIARGYDREKVVDNVEAELIGVVASEAFTAYGSTRVFEADTTRTKPRGACERVLKGIRAAETGPRRIDWSRGYNSGKKLTSLLSED